MARAVASQDVDRRFGAAPRATTVHDDYAVLCLFFLCALATVLLLSPPVLGDSVPTALLSCTLATAALAYVHAHQLLPKSLSFKRGRTVFRRWS